MGYISPADGMKVAGEYGAPFSAELLERYHLVRRSSPPR